VAAGDDSIICLDQENISPAGETQIEPCDLYSVAAGAAIFQHVKVSTLSSQLSHLFNQGTNAIELIKLEAEAVEKLKKLIEAAAGPAKTASLVAPLDEQKYEVIFAVVTHKDKSGKSGNLPLFSRISLMRSMKALQLMSVKGGYGFVPDETVKTPGKPKKRKKKA
jgi:uncharacterized protein (TIGR04141 family)